MNQRNSDQPLVSVVIPTKNSQDFLESCLRSVQRQRYPNIEVIVVDNYSSDNTTRIARKYTPLVFTKGHERSLQRNFGAKKAIGKYVLMIDSDMDLSPLVIKQSIKTMLDNPQIKGLVIPEISVGEGFWAQCKKLEKSFYEGESWMEAARFFDKQAFVSVGGYHEGMVSGEDWDLSQRIAKIGKLSRIKAFIYHNEGTLTLIQTLKKKFYYASQFAKYLEENREALFTPQTNVLSRYGLYFRKTDKWLSQPLVFIGMLFMKTAELATGAIALLLTKVQKQV